MVLKNYIHPNEDLSYVFESITIPPVLQIDIDSLDSTRSGTDNYTSRSSSENRSMTDNMRKLYLLWMNKSNPKPLAAKYLDTQKPWAWWSEPSCLKL